MSKKGVMFAATGKFLKKAMLICLKKSSILFFSTPKLSLKNLVSVFYGARNSTLASEIAFHNSWEYPPLKIRIVTSGFRRVTWPSERFSSGVCAGDNSTCLGCHGVPNSGRVWDACGVCGGDGSSCTNITKLVPASLPDTGGTVNIHGTGFSGEVKCIVGEIVVAGEQRCVLNTRE